MPNIAELYTELTKSRTLLNPDEQSESSGPTFDPARHQLELNWQQSTITKEKILNIENQIKELFNQCVDLANVYPGIPYQEVIKRLNKIHALRELLKDFYGKRDN